MVNESYNNALDCFLKKFIIGLKLLVNNNNNNNNTNSLV